MCIYIDICVHIHRYMCAFTLCFSELRVTRGLGTIKVNFSYMYISVHKYVCIKALYSKICVDAVDRYMCAYTHVYTHICRLRQCIQICTHTRCVHMYVCIYKYVYTYICTRCLYIHIYTYLYVHMKALRLYTYV